MAITREAQGVKVTLWIDGSPRSVWIEVDGQRLSLLGTQQLRALHWAVGEVLASDPRPDDRPKQPGDITVRWYR